MTSQNILTKKGGTGVYENSGLQKERMYNTERMHTSKLMVYITHPGPLKISLDK
jgi:hypothetical protein